MLVSPLLFVSWIMGKHHRVTCCQPACLCKLRQIHLVLQFLILSRLSVCLSYIESVDIWPGGHALVNTVLV